MDVSVIMAACNQGDWVRRTVPLAKESLGRIEHEIIVVDDHSTDNCCKGLGRDALIVYPRHRLGVSGSRRLGYERSQGSVVIFSDPHCEYPNGCLASLATLAAKSDAIYQPVTRHSPDGRRWAGGMLHVTDRGLTVRGSKEPAKHPALYNTIYAMNRGVYDQLGGWPHLPGVWGTSEQALSLMAWFADVPIIVDEESEGIHYLYQKNRRFPFTVPRHDWVNNVHWVHAAFFPETYQSYWKPIILGYHGESIDHEKHLKSDEFKSFRQHVESLRKKSEREFFTEVLQEPYPNEVTSKNPFDALIAKHKQSVSPKTEVRQISEEEDARLIDSSIRWLLRTIPGCVKGMRAISIGSDYAARQLGVTGVHSVENVRIADQGRNGHARKEDIYELTDSDLSWDIVSAISVLDKVDDPARARDELVRVASRNGWVFVTVDPNDNIADEQALQSFLLENEFVDHRSIKTQTIAPIDGRRQQLRALVRRQANASRR